MTPLPPRSFSIQNDITAKLRPMMNAEAIEILARCTATVMARDPSQSKHFINVFGSALDREYTYLTTRHREGVSS
jgi:hypothetical protein